MKARVPTRPVYAPDVIRVTGVRAYSHLVRIASICGFPVCLRKLLLKPRDRETACNGYIGRPALSSIRSRYVHSPRAPDEDLFFYDTCFSARATRIFLNYILRTQTKNFYSRARAQAKYCAV